jgi:GNAT superfamily N-acetyltransferase
MPIWFAPIGHKAFHEKTLERAVANSLCFALLRGKAQIGFARVVTDAATFAYLCDVYILEDHRGKGLGKWLMECLMGHPSLQGLRRFSLATRDAHRLYRQFGFRELSKPESTMEILRPRHLSSLGADVVTQPSRFSAWCVPKTAPEVVSCRNRPSETQLVRTD